MIGEDVMGREAGSDENSFELVEGRPDLMPLR